jgi:hypothetical protein
MAFNALLVCKVFKVYQNKNGAKAPSMIITFNLLFVLTMARLEFFATSTGTRIIPTNLDFSLGRLGFWGWALWRPLRRHGQWSLSTAGCIR